MRRTTKTALTSVLGMTLLAAAGCSDKPAPANLDYPEQHSPGAQVLLQKCGSCHAPPLPSAHVAKVWPSVLERMQMRMTTKGQVALMPRETGVLLDYLQRHAAAAQE
jgi:hypothetical protein